MGAWGEGIMDNDVAADLQEDLKTKEDISDMYVFVKEMEEESPEYEANNDVGYMALAIEAMRRGFSIPFLIHKRIFKAYKNELGKERLEDWKDPKARKKALKQFGKTMDVYCEGQFLLKQ